jgi:hypothetical protein
MNRTMTSEETLLPPAIRAFNAVGYAFRRRGASRPISPEQILSGAIAASGLSEWGDEHDLAPLFHLTEALEHTASLSPFGRLFLKRLLITIVSNRFKIHNYLLHNPHIMELRLRDPLIIVGMPRTGTTLLYNLLALDANARPILSWESKEPAIANKSPGSKDFRIKENMRRVNLLNWLAPGIKHIHPLDPVGPEECTWLMANTLRSPFFCMFARIPSYERWLWELDDNDWSMAYHEYTTQLLILQNQRDGGHWLLKSPSHLLSLASLLATVPRVKIVFTERDPVEVIPSVCSLYSVFRSISTDRVDSAALGAEILENLSKTEMRAESALSSHPNQVFRVRYKDLVKDKKNIVKQIYAHFGMQYTELFNNNIDAWLNRSAFHNTHKYGLEQFGLSENDIIAKFPKRISTL